MSNKRKKREFSKVLLIQESLLIWIITISGIVMAFLCIMRNSFVELPWIVSLITAPWAAYGVSQAFYYKKSEKENVKGGIVFEHTMKDREAVG